MLFKENNSDKASGDDLNGLFKGGNPTVSVVVAWPPVVPV